MKGKLYFIFMTLLAFCICLTLLPVSALAADPPVLVSAVVAPGGHVELTFDKAMATLSGGPAGFGVVDTFGVSKGVLSAQVDGVDNKKILLTLATTFTGGDNMAQVSYVPGTVQSLDGELLGAIPSFLINNPLPHPTIDLIPPPDGMVGVSYDHLFTATGGAPPYTYHVFSGSLPPGLTLSTSGAISGTPSAGGSFGDPPSILKIGVRDANLAFDSRDIIIVIYSNLPTVVTNAVTGVTSTSATLAGEVIDDGGSTVTERGFVYSETPNPTIGGAGVTGVIAGSGIGSFSSVITGLLPGRDYYVRAYAISSAGTAYSDIDRDFTTLASAIVAAPISPPTPTPPDKDLDDIPKTGGTDSGLFWWLLCGASAAGIAALLVFGRKKLGRR